MKFLAHTIGATFLLLEREGHGVPLNPIWFRSTPDANAMESGFGCVWLRRWSRPVGYAATPNVGNKLLHERVGRRGHYGDHITLDYGS
jgi:hypothetical protein